MIKTINHILKLITNTKKQKFTISLHHGRLITLPVNFEFPQGMTLFQLVRNWLIGDIDENIPPFQHLYSYFIKHDKNTIMQYNRIKL